MAELKTRQNDAKVEAFLDQVEDEARRNDCKALVILMSKLTGCAPRMWGRDIVGFGHYHYHYASGREGDWFVTGFSPRKRDLTLYIMTGFSRYGSLMERLGKFKAGKSCLYVKRLSDLNPAVLEELVRESVADMKKTYPST